SSWCCRCVCSARFCIRATPDGLKQFFGGCIACNTNSIRPCARGKHQTQESARILRSGDIVLTQVLLLLLLSSFSSLRPISNKTIPKDTLQQTSRLRPGSLEPVPIESWR